MFTPQYKFSLVMFGLFILAACNFSAPGFNPTVTPLPSSPTGLEDLPGSQHAFMMSYVLKETASCPSSTPCDTVFIPTIGLYFRGDFEVGESGKIQGAGVIQFVHMDACQTLKPDISSCVLKGYEAGSFSISGKIKGDRVTINLGLDMMPAISVMMASESGLNRVDIPVGSIYHEEMSQVFDAAGIFNRDISGSVLLGAKTPVDTFRGSFTFAEGRTMQGLGSLFFIDVNTPLPEFDHP